MSELRTSASRDQVVSRLREIFAARSAHDVAELFLSPHVDASLFRESTSEEGPTLWVVNRSDVYDETLEILREHSVEGIRKRAGEKLAARRTRLTLLSPPVFDLPLEETPDYMVEDVLGHPLVPFEAILHFVHHPLEDYRGSSALSLTRRLLEHPPNWALDLGLKLRVQDAFARMLVEDPSPFVRAYAARVPMLAASVLTEAYRREPHPRVQAKILQNPAAPRELAHEALASELSEATQSRFEIAALDARVERGAREAFVERATHPLTEMARLVSIYLLG